MNLMHSLSAYMWTKGKLVTYYKIRMAPLDLFTMQAIFSRIYWLLCRWVCLVKQPCGSSSAEAFACVVPTQSSVVLRCNVDFRHHGTAFSVLFSLPEEFTFLGAFTKLRFLIFQQFSIYGNLAITAMLSLLIPLCVNKRSQESKSVCWSEV